MPVLLSCPSCGSHFELDDNRLPSRRLRLHCPICRGLIVVQQRSARRAIRPSVGSDDPTLWYERLADALISDILHYHRQRVVRARKDETLLREFADEIHMAWTDYKSRLDATDPRARRIFNAAINRILGEGRRIL